jgi:hypothetical protein
LYRRLAGAARRDRDRVLLDYESRPTTSENEMAGCGVRRTPCGSEVDT